jgi:hypothetical protein
MLIPPSLKIVAFYEALGATTEIVKLLTITALRAGINGPTYGFSCPVICAF